MTGGTKGDWKMARELLRRRAALRLCCAGLFFAGALAADDAAIEARNAWVRLPLPSKTDTAMYVILENHSSQRRAVVSGSSEAAASVELHEMKMDHMVMRMNPVAEVKIPAKGKASFNPDGYHIMLFGIKTRPTVGDSITVTLKLDDGSTVPVTGTVRK
jgi:copper(I)-binding protein